MATADIYFGTPDGGGLLITSYQIQWREIGQQWSGARQEVATMSPHEVSGLADDTDYEFRVRAVNSSGEGVWSAVVIVIIPTTLPQLRTVDVYFGAPDDGDSLITSFQVQWRKLDQAWSGARQDNVSGSPHSISNLDLRTEYQFRVRAVNDIGHGDWSVEISVMTGAPAPVPGPPVPGVPAEGVDIEGDPVPGPLVAGPLVPGPLVPGVAIEGPLVAGPSVPGPLVPGARVYYEGPPVAGPLVPGPTVAGPSVPGPSVPGPPVAGPSVPGPLVPGPTDEGAPVLWYTQYVPAGRGPPAVIYHYNEGPPVAGPLVPGPLVPGPLVPGPRVPGPRVPGPRVPGPPVAGPSVPGPTLSYEGPPVAGPDIPGPLVQGPDIPGPLVPGPLVPGPLVPGPTDEGLPIEGPFIPTFVPGPDIPG